MVNEQIKNRRIDLGLTEADVCRMAELKRSEYRDIEWYEDEALTVIPLKTLKRVVKILSFDLLDLSGLVCSFCNQNHLPVQEFCFPRNELIASKRKQIGMSVEDLGERLGFYPNEIEKLENDPEHLESWPVDLIIELSAAIDVPPQVLMQVKCRKCGAIECLSPDVTRATST